MTLGSARSPREEALFKRALAEPRRVVECTQFKVSSAYKSTDDEGRFMKELLTKEPPEVCCRYVMYKIYHTLLLLHDVSLFVFGCDFVLNEHGCYALYGVTIYDLHSRRSDIMSLAKPTDIIRPTDELVAEMEKEQAEFAAKQAVQDPDAKIDRERREEMENREFLRRLEVIILQNKTSDPKSEQASTLRKAKILRNQKYRNFWSVIPPPPAAEDRSHKLEIYQELKDDFQKQIQPLQKEIDQSEDATLHKQIVEQTDKAFMEVNPHFRKKLSELVMVKDYQFRKEYAAFLSEKKHRQNSGQQIDELPTVENNYSQRLDSIRRSRPEVSSFTKTDISQVIKSREDVGSQRQYPKLPTGRDENKSVLSATLTAHRTLNHQKLPSFKLDVSGSTTRAENSAKDPNSSQQPSSGRSFLNGADLGSAERNQQPYLQFSSKTDRLVTKLQQADTVESTQGLGRSSRDHRTRQSEQPRSSRTNLITDKSLNLPEKLSKTADQPATGFPQLKSHSRYHSFAGSVEENSSGIVMNNDESRSLVLEKLKQNPESIRNSTKVWTERYKTELLRKKHQNIQILHKSPQKVVHEKYSGARHLTVKEMVDSGNCPGQVISKFHEMIQKNINPAVWRWAPGARELKTIESEMRALQYGPGDQESPTKTLPYSRPSKNTSQKLLGTKNELRIMLRKQTETMA